MNAAGRRYKQALSGYANLAPRQRPNYCKKDAATSARHQQKVIEGERRRAMGSKKGKKS